MICFLAKGRQPARQNDDKIHVWRVVGFFARQQAENLIAFLFVFLLTPFRSVDQPRRTRQHDKRAHFVAPFPTRGVASRQTEVSKVFFRLFRYSVYMCRNITHMPDRYCQQWQEKEPSYRYSGNILSFLMYISVFRLILS